MASSGLIPYPETASLLGPPYESTRAGIPPRSIPSSPEPSPGFTPGSTWGFEPDADFSLKASNQGRSSQSDRSGDFNRRAQPQLIVASLFPTLAATAQFLLLLYLLDVYISLPQTPSGARPRLSPVYSIWPYIACVGSLRETAYKIFGFLIACFSIGTFAADVYLYLDIATARWLRWLRLAASCVSGCAMIAVVFASEDDRTHLHLYLVSIQGVAFTVVKTLTWLIDHTMRRKYPLLQTDLVSLVSKRWKYVCFIIAAPAAILTVVGIYACHDPIDIETAGTTCYYLSAVAAISDWIYFLVSVPFLLSLAYDLFQAEHLASVIARPQILNHSQREMDERMSYHQV